MISVGLTGSIGMGKSTTRAMFAAAGAFTWDADEAVHRLYAAGGAGARAIAAVAPEAVKTGAVDRAILRQACLADPALLKRVEKAIHSLVGEDRARAKANAEASGADVAVFDVPLIFETGGESAYDLIVVVSAPDTVQRERVLARPGMTEDAFNAILAKQVPDAEKRNRADLVIDTGHGLDSARLQVEALMRRLTKGDQNA